HAGALPTSRARHDAVRSFTGWRTRLDALRAGLLPHDARLRARRTFERSVWGCADHCAGAMSLFLSRSRSVTKVRALSLPVPARTGRAACEYFKHLSASAELDNEAPA